jgi:4'-phosphopantetheinyl transferase
MDVHLYRVELALPPGAVRQLETLLSPDELARADRFAHARLRRRFVAGRGQLRLLLARYLHAVPEEIVFAYSPSGKPTLGTAPSGPPPLEFNVAHSEDLALMAFTRGRRLGVDVERVREMPDLEEMARRFFAPSELAALLALPAAQQTAAFFRIWTRKEAFLKATGEGLSRPLDSFSVAPAVDAPRLLELRDAAEGPAHWQLVHLDPAQDFCGALAVEGAGWALAQFSFFP